MLSFKEAGHLESARHGRQAHALVPLDSLMQGRGLAPLQSRLDGSPQVAELERLSSLLNQPPQRGMQDPVQRVAKAKQEVAPPEHPSQQVPDLSGDLVERISAAQTAEARQGVLDELKAFAAANGLLENEDPDALEFRYSAHGGHGNMALTELVPNAEGRIEDNAPIRITFYPDAFAQGPGVLYSTFRHELIHAGQRSLTPNSEDYEEAPGTSLDDDYIHDDLYEPLNTLEGRAKVNPNMQLPLQELETHSWEIMNAQRTGVGPDYTWTTIYYMIEYQKKLSNYLGVLDERKNKEIKVKKIKSNSGRGKASRNADPILAERMLNYWRSYIVKALGLAHEAYGYYCGHLDGSEAHKAAAQAASEEADQLMRVMA